MNLRLVGGGSAAHGAFQSVAATSDPPHAFGTEAVDRLGRRYRYVKAGAVTLVVGNILQATAQDTNVDTLVLQAAAAVGDTTLSITGDGTVAANVYSGGLLVVDTSTAGYYTYKIKSHTAMASSTTFTVTLESDTPIQVALTTSHRVSFIKNPYKDVIQAPVTTLTGAVVGVAVYAIPTTDYGWIGTRGMHGVLVKGTPGPGVAVVSPGSAAGAVVVDGAAAATQVVGSMGITAADGLVCPVFLNLP